MPIRIGRYGPGASSEDLDVLFAAVTGLGKDGAALLPESMRIEFPSVSAGASGSAGSEPLFRALADWIDDQVSELVLGQRASTRGVAGSLGGQDDQEAVRRTLKRADARSLSRCLTRLGRVIVDVNVAPRPDMPYPRVTVAAAEVEDLDMLASALQKLIPLGLRVEAGEVRDKFRLRKPAADAEVLQPAPSAAPGGMGAQRTSRNRASVGDELTDDLVEQALADWQPQMQPVLAPIRDLARTASDLDDFAARLPTLLDDMDATTLVQSLATAAFQARGVGDQRD